MSISSTAATPSTVLSSHLPSVPISLTAATSTTLISSRESALPIFSTSVILNHHATLSMPTPAVITNSQSAPSLHSTTDPGTMQMFRDYGSGSLQEWLDSLCIPLNLESPRQVKDLWELGEVNCPPLNKWTVAMQNHRS